jgi:hypothetical protein
MPLTLKRISAALRVSRVRVEQWISRGYFRTPDKPIFGKTRDWEFDDAIRLAVFIELVEAHLTTEQAGVLTQLDFPRSGYLIAWKGLHHPSGVPGKIYSDVWYQEIVQPYELSDFLKNPDLFISVVINLDNLYDRVSAALERVQ